MAEQPRASEDTTDCALIAQLEGLGRRAWPSLEIEALDGWILGTSGAYTRRANAVWPVLDGEQPLSERVERSEAFYAARNRRAVFKLQPAARPSTLDEFLDERGYRRTSETIVKTLELDFFAERASKRSASVAVREPFEADWFEASVSLGKVDEDRRDDYRAIIDHLEATGIKRLFGRAERDSRIASLALGCLVDGVVSLVEVATAEQDRGQRLAEHVLRAIIQKARAKGAARALLSVEADNSSARRLYERLGFVERYRYWYREAPDG